MNGPRPTAGLSRFAELSLRSSRASSPLRASLRARLAGEAPRYGRGPFTQTSTSTSGTGRFWAGLVLAVALAAGLGAQQPAFVPGPYVDSLPDAKLALDATYYAQKQVAFADLWNGGVDGLGGLGAYSPSFSGYFQPGLDRQWNRSWAGSTTVIAQSRGVFGNVEAFLAARKLGKDGQRFLVAAEAGGQTLLDQYRDKTKGGFYWTVTEKQKQGYGQMHAWLALCRLASISSDPRWLAAATTQFHVIQDHLLDSDWAGAVLPGKDRNWSSVQGNKNIDTFTHYFETLQAYGDVAPEPEKTSAAKALLLAGDLLVSRLAVPIPQRPELRMVAYNYADDWTPSREPYTRDTQWSGAQHASPGHAAELSFLISRAVQRGAPERWLTTARALLDGVIAFANSPQTGAMVYETIGYDMKPLPGNPDNDLYIYWAQAENLRALMHWSFERDPKYRSAFLKAQKFVNETLTDRVWGDWYQEISVATLEPTRMEKGDNWKGDYHEAMLMAEALRLGNRP